MTTLTLPNGGGTWPNMVSHQWSFGARLDREMTKTTLVHVIEEELLRFLTMDKLVIDDMNWFYKVLHKPLA